MLAWCHADPFLKESPKKMTRSAGHAHSHFAICNRRPLQWNHAINDSHNHKKRNHEKHEVPRKILRILLLVNMPGWHKKGVEPQVTEHRIHRDWCPICKEHVEPKVRKATLLNESFAVKDSLFGKD